jgi:hypothetical protein
VDIAQRFSQVIFRHYVDGDLVDEGVILPDDVSADERLLVAHYAATHPADLPPGFSRMGDRTPPPRPHSDRVPPRRLLPARLSTATAR